MRVTASRVGLLEFCAWWARPEAIWDNRSSAAADRGTRFHKAIANYVQTGARVPVDDDIQAEYGRAIEWVESYGRLRLIPEMAFAWDPQIDTAECIGQLSERDYSSGRGRLCGSADIVAIDSIAGTGYIGDWATGSGEGKGPQLRALAVMLARAEGIDTVTVEALEVTAAGVRAVIREELDAFALAGIAGELAEHIAAIETAQPQPGAHCGERYCSARLSCPVSAAATAEVLDVIPAEALVRRGDRKITDPITSAEDAIYTIDVLRLMSAWIDAKKDEIKSLVPVDGWTTEDGRTLKETRATVEAFDKSKAVELCKQLGATDEQLGSLYYTFQKSNGLRVSGGGTKPRTRRIRAA